MNNQVHCTFRVATRLIFARHSKCNKCICIFLVFTNNITLIIVHNMSVSQSHNCIFLVFTNTITLMCKHFTWAIGVWMWKAGRLLLHFINELILAMPCFLYWLNPSNCCNLMQFVGNASLLILCVWFCLLVFWISSQACDI